MPGPELRFVGCGRNSCVSITALFDSGADLTILAEEPADEIGVFRLGEKTVMQSVTGQQFPVELAFMLVELGNDCKSLALIGVTEKANLSGHSAIVGNDIMSQRCLEILFPSKIGDDLRISCHC